MCAKFGSKWFRNVNLYKVLTNKLLALHVRCYIRSINRYCFVRKYSAVPVQLITAIIIIIIIIIIILLYVQL
jgi:hypothetical protein